MLSSAINSPKELQVYQLAYQLSMDLFEHSKSFPPEERYALTSQIRRSSRSVTLNLREAWAKRRYQPHLISKLRDSDGENSETETSIDYAFDCGYLSATDHKTLIEKNHIVGRMLGAMLKSPEKSAQKP